MRVGPYDIIEECGRGGRGVVLRARAPDGTVVALKVLQAGSDAQALARFDRERRLLATFGRNEGFVPLLDAGTQGGSPFLVMPFLEGGTLRQRLAKGALLEPEALLILQRLAGAMATAHERGIIHRDLKPENILFGAPNEPLVADLGLGKHFKRSTPGASQTIMLSIEGQFRGTLGYMAPEQTKDAMSAGPPADVWALGAILYECVTGQPAFEGESPVEVISKIVDGRYGATLRTTRPWLDAIVAKALEPDPAHRYADARELAAALAAGPAGFRPRSKLPRVLAIVTVLAVLGAGAAFVATRTVARVEDPAAHLAAARAATDAAVRVNEAKRAIEAAKGDAPEARTIRGEAFEIVARARLDAGDAVGAFAAASEALALGPELEARQLLVAQAGLKAGRPDEALAAVAKRLDDPRPPLDALRAAAAAHLAHARFAEAEAAASRGLSMHGDDPGLNLARGRALRGLGRSADALQYLSAAQRAGERDARAELAVAAIEAVKVDPCPDPAMLISGLDKPAARLEADAVTLMATIEKEWPAARTHPQAHGVGLAAFDRICSSVAKARSVQPGESEKWAPLIERVKRIHATIVAGRARESFEADAILAVLCTYVRDTSLCERCIDRSAGLPLRLRYALRASLGVSAFMPITAAAAGQCHFDADAPRGLQVLEMALAEEPAELEKAERQDLFLRELHRTVLRCHAWALWHRLALEARGDAAVSSPDLKRAEESGRAALATRSAFEVFGDAPVLVALVPVLLLEEKLDEAERLIAEFEAFHSRWNDLQQSSRDFGRSFLSHTWSEVFELRGDLELRRHRYARAVTAFERATRELGARSSWYGLAKARRGIGDEAGATDAERKARTPGLREPYLVWLER